MTLTLRLFISAVNSREQDWVETLVPSVMVFQKLYMTCIKTIGKCELTCWVWGYKHQALFQVTDGSYMSFVGHASCNKLDA